MKDKAFTMLAWVLFLAGLTYFYYKYNGLADKIPLHFNLVGTPDKFGDKRLSWVFFMIIGFLLLIIGLIKKADPSIFNFPAGLKKASQKAHQLSIELLSIIQLWLGGLVILYSHRIVEGGNTGILLKQFPIWVYALVLLTITLIYFLKIKALNRP